MEVTSGHPGSLETTRVYQWHLYGSDCVPCKWYLCDSVLVPWKWQESMFPAVGICVTVSLFPAVDICVTVFLFPWICVTMSPLPWSGSINVFPEDDISMAVSMIPGNYICLFCHLGSLEVTPALQYLRLPGFNYCLCDSYSCSLAMTSRFDKKELLGNYLWEINP